MSSETASAKNTPSQRQNPLKIWLHQQRHAIQFSLERLWFNPISTWITLATIAIALSLPTSLYLLVHNLQTLTDSKSEIPTITIFLKPNISEQEAKDQAELIADFPEVKHARVMSSNEAMVDFQNRMGSDDIIRSLGKVNPFPNMIIVTPDLTVLGGTEEGMSDFIARIRASKNVESVANDTSWIMRLHAIFKIVNRILLIVFALLGLTVLLVIGNTIRLDIENRKEEIRVTRLIGATNTYIRRPFLYNGLWLGFFGGVLSLLILHLALHFLKEPVAELALRYNTNFSLVGISPVLSLEILVVSAILGLIGAWIAVGRYLRQREISE